MSTRREFLRTSVFASGAAFAPQPAPQGGNTSSPPTPRPNILMICADQFRSDFVGANGDNPSVKTPNIDSLAARGVNFRKAVCNQPLCSPSRASFLTGVSATRAGVWKLGMEPDHTLPTIATMLREAGYSTNFIGKWHVSNITLGEKRQMGWIPPGPSRMGFDDLWEGANVLELVSNPTQGDYWDTDGRNIGYHDRYRVDFLTDRAVKFLERSHDKPWLLFLSQLEPHQQNSVDAMVPPERYAKAYDDPFIPQDLRDMPGNWRSRIGGYYGCVQAIDDSVGRVLHTLEATRQLDNTVIVFFSDHGCHFRTRMGEYKRSPFDSAIRVPMIMAGPGFDQALELDEVVSLWDLMPTLLDGAGVQAPASLQGKSLLPLSTDRQARKRWDSTAYIQISASMVGRALRTPEWMYCAYDPSADGNEQPVSSRYADFALYQVGADPFQKTNLIGRPEYKEKADQLRAELKRRIVANGEPEPQIDPTTFYV